MVVTEQLVCFTFWLQWTVWLRLICPGEPCQTGVPLSRDTSRRVWYFLASSYSFPLLIFLYFYLPTSFFVFLVLTLDKKSTWTFEWRFLCRKHQQGETCLWFMILPQYRRSYSVIGRQVPELPWVKRKAAFLLSGLMVMWYIHCFWFVNATREGQAEVRHSGRICRLPKLAITGARHSNRSQPAAAAGRIWYSIWEWDEIVERIK